MKENVHLDLKAQKSVSSIPQGRTEFNLWLGLGEEQSQMGRAVEVSVECLGPCRGTWISEIGSGYRVRLRMFE